MPQSQQVERDHLGRGWSFPPRWYRPQTKVEEFAGSKEKTPRNEPPVVRTVDRIEDVNQAIHIILETPLGARVMQPGFGSDIHRYVFASIDARTKTGLADAVRKALLLWEQRIRNVDVRVEDSATEADRLDVLISFTVETHRMRRSLILPFYMEQPEALR